MTQDLNRRTLCLLGLPIDVTTMNEAIGHVRDAVRDRRRLFLTTPNVSFLIGAQTNPAFRGSVLASNLCLADGMPLVWLSRLLGVPMPERVTGSGLFERLIAEPAPSGQAPIKVYFFGGPPGVAARAGAELNRREGGLVCVGHASPGFGSVEAMSEPEVIRHINDSQADFVVVALGAAKGQAWIQHNLDRIEAPVISHLGAVVNFTAGTVSRSPVWLQRIGMEWAWRIKEEPQLWRRYWHDAQALASLLVRAVLPQVVFGRVPEEGRWAAVSWRQDRAGRALVIRGSIGGTVPTGVREALNQLALVNGPVCLDLRGMRVVGPEMQGSILMLEKTLAAADRTLSVRHSRTVARQMRRNRLQLQSALQSASTTSTR